MNREDLKALEFKVRMMRENASLIRAALHAAYGRDHDASLLSEDLFCASADLAAKLCELQPPLEVPREAAPRWDKKKAGARS